MISIVIPVYQTPVEFIAECAESIRHQTFQDYEVVLVNDGSDYEVSGFLRSLAKKNWRLYERPRGGISKALNFGIQNAKHELICRMDADDVMLPDRLRKQFDYFQVHQVDVLGGQMELFGCMSEVTSHPLDIPRDIMRDSDWFMNHPTVMFKKSSIVSIGGYNSEFDGTEDFELWCRALSKNLTLRNLPDVLVRHRRHHGNASDRTSVEAINGKNNQVRNYYLRLICNS